VLRDSIRIIRRLRAEGFELVSVRGSHHKFWHPRSKRIVIVPHPRKDIPKGTMRSIYERSGIEEEVR
jgi:predicted RNA binding protein YcfA (HicA-like mRNA interferase family)